MLKSLYSGVSGLQSHQVAMDVESNNIANVNTVGYKYSRANFSDLLAQTSSIATAPQGELGGKNALQVGLGSTVSSTTRIFSQGSIQNTGKNTDIAIQGDGFFIVSPDGGSTYSYTRAGDFKFDANGNFVDNNGYIVQGWLRDDDTGLVDSNASIVNINIAPGLTTPANPSSEVVIKANLNSGPTVESFSPAYEVDSSGVATDGDGNIVNSGSMGVMFNGSGEAFSLQESQGIWASFVSTTKDDSLNNSVLGGTGDLDITFTFDDGATTEQITTSNSSATVYTVAENGYRFASAINAKTATTGVSASYDSVNEKIDLTNTNDSSSASHNINVTANNVNSGITTGTETTAYKYQYTSSATTLGAAGVNKTFHTISDLSSALETQAQYLGMIPSSKSYTVTTDGTDDAFNISINAFAPITVALGGPSVPQVEQTILDADLVDGDTISVTIEGNTYTRTLDLSDPLLNEHDKVMTAFANDISIGEAGITAVYDNVGNTITSTADVAGTPFTIATDYTVTAVAIGTAATTPNLDVDGTAGVSEVISTTLDADLVHGDIVSLTVNGTSYSATFDAATLGLDTHAGVMAALVTAIETDVNVNVGGVVLDVTNRILTVTANAVGADTLDGGGAIVTGVVHGAVASGAIAGAGVDVANNTARTADENGAAYAAAINAVAITGISAAYSSTDGLVIQNTNTTTATIAVTDDGQSGIPIAGDSINPAVDGDGDGNLNENNISVTVNSQGKLEISNPGGSDDGDYDIDLKITGYSSSASSITENTEFVRSMEAMNAVLASGTTGKAYSQAFNAATHSSSIDIFDSLGSKHTIKVDFRKTALNTSTGSTWGMVITVPEPATIDTEAPTYQKTGTIRFSNDGSLSTYNPPNISFSGNNGSASDQQVSIDLGSLNSFDGMTSFDSTSSTSGISQDGYTGGDLVGMRVDQSGTVIGSFSNGRSFGLAQVAMAKFTNNEGLATEGGNTYTRTANSGDPIVGTAATSGRGYIQSSALEASNVDLSNALTQLIIIQRGYQANGKTITTSDTLLETLIGLKR